MGVASYTEKKIERYIEETTKTLRAVRAHKPSDDFWRHLLQEHTNQCRKACAELR